MHTDPTLVHSVADLRREALLAEAAARLRSEPDRLWTAPPPGPLRRLATRLGSAAGWLVTEFEARPFVPVAPTTAAATGRAT